MSSAEIGGSPPLASLRQQAVTWWQARSARERQAVLIVGSLVALSLAWSVLAQPALRIARDAPAQLDQLDAQYQQMQRIAAESTGLRGAARVSPAQAAAALKSATDRLGDRGRLTLLGERATLTLTGVSPEALRAWLNEARSGARARPIEAQLQRSPTGFTGTLNVALGGSQ